MVNRSYSKSSVLWIAGLCAMATLWPDSARAQQSPIGRVESFALDTGLIQNLANTEQVVYQREIRVADVPWIRLAFDNVNLSRGSTLRITSLADGAVQDLDAAALEQWYQTSAFFNGDAVLLEIIAGPHTLANSVEISEVMVGWEPIIERTICGPTDDRVASNDPAVARMLTASLGSGCTATIFGEGGCMTTAGHCVAQPVIQFNVPLSSAGGALQHPGPQDQYTMDTSTLQFSNGGIGSDWGIFECFPNSQTDLTTFQAQGALYHFAPSLPSMPLDIYFYGYGADNGSANQTQQLSEGPVTLLSGTVIQHQADSEGGNSGSAILNAATNEIIGIHTNAGCSSGGGSNSGTSIGNGSFFAAILSSPCPDLSNLGYMEFPNGVPTTSNANVDFTVQVNAVGVDGTPDPGTGKLYYRTVGVAGPFTEVAMNETSPNEYEATIPGDDCESEIEFYFSYDDVLGVTIYGPDNAPEQKFVTLFADSFDVQLSFNFESADGWVKSGAVNQGEWQRGVPNPGNGAPDADFDGSGSCWVTGLNPNIDVDGGPTFLNSPDMDVTGLVDPVLEYATWFSNNLGTNPNSDTLTVEVSENGGANWVNLENIGPIGVEVSGGWFVKRYRILDAVPGATTQFRVRFLAFDSLASDSNVEAGVDAVRVYDIVCASSGLDGDFDNDGDVDLSDFSQFSLCFGGANLPPAGSCPPGIDADFDDDGDVDLGDFATFSLNFTGPL